MTISDVIEGAAEWFYSVFAKETPIIRTYPRAIRDAESVLIVLPRLPGPRGMLIEKLSSIISSLRGRKVFFAGIDISEPDTQDIKRLSGITPMHIPIRYWGTTPDITDMEPSLSDIPVSIDTNWSFDLPSALIGYKLGIPMRVGFAPDIDKPFYNISYRAAESEWDSFFHFWRRGIDGGV